MQGYKQCFYKIFRKGRETKELEERVLGRHMRLYEKCENAREQEKGLDYQQITVEAFTLDPRLTEIIYETFFKMFKEGLIYRDKRIINQLNVQL